MSTRTPARQRDSQEHCGGFTLIETLAALAITAAIFVAAAGLIHNVVIGFDRGTRTITTADRLVLAVERLAGDFAAARFVQKAVDGKVAFIAGDGNAGRLTFVSGAGIVAGPRGEEIVSLSIEPASDVTRLIRRRAPWRGPSGRFGDVTPQDPVVLVEGNYDMAFSFGKADPDGRMTWTSNWADTNSIPQAIRLIIRDRTNGIDILPRAEFSLRSDMNISCASGGPSCGGAAGGPKQPDKKPGAEPQAKSQEGAN
jgi:prepilin-type N-terminal cleavage/methylation domain-containing protein